MINWKRIDRSTPRTSEDILLACAGPGGWAGTGWWKDGEWWASYPDEGAQPIATWTDEPTHWAELEIPAADAGQVEQVLVSADDIHAVTEHYTFDQQNAGGRKPCNCKACQAMARLRAAVA